MVQKVLLSKSTLSPDEDLKCAVERRDQYQSDNRGTNDKTKPFNPIVLISNRSFH